ncbi:hypothetical protein B0E34_17150 [Chryseobacterium mucoviscidosis]|uniref:Uncharacterized protein n=2 Tax=Chryseobacterium TaxID=59732 RepID=A0A3D9BGL6_9FLAO|nr:hypothetical protein B0E34_17150 [Chryseobacterium mucoviscidosis]REC52654.1 hypothetical protein DRF68_02715 [Candidatus Chryseobacterium massiliae]
MKTFNHKVGTVAQMVEQQITFRFWQIKFLCIPVVGRRFESCLFLKKNEKKLLDIHKGAIYLKAILVKAQGFYLR